MKQIIVFLIFIGSISQLSGQSKELSISISSYKISGTYFPNYTDEGNEFSSNYKMINSSFGFYFPVYSPQSNISFGINAALAGGATYAATSFNNDGNLLYDFGTPVTGTLRFGAGSGKHATAPIGIGIGYGYIFHLLVVDGGDIFNTNKDEPFLTYLRPYGFAEIVFDFQKRNRSLFDDFKIQFAFKPTLDQRSYNTVFDGYQSSSLDYFSVSVIKFFPFK